MKLLLDSHVVVWALVEPKRMSARARTVLSSQDNEIFISAITVWELWSKFLKRPLDPMMRIVDAGLSGFEECLEILGAKQLDVSVRHLIAGARLPQLHGDPFDRILLGQALVDDLTLVTRDGWVRSYPNVAFVEA